MLFRSEEIAHLSRGCCTSPCSCFYCCWSWSSELGKIALLGIVIVALLLGYEHSLVRSDDLSKLNAAFFTMNGVIAVVFFVFVAADKLIGTDLRYH